MASARYLLSPIADSMAVGEVIETDPVVVCDVEIYPVEVGNVETEPVLVVGGVDFEIERVVGTK